MKRVSVANIRNKQFPIVVEKDEDGFYVAECALFQGCYSQGKSLDECLANVKEAILLCLGERKNQEICKTFDPKEMSLHTITLSQ